MWSRNVRKKKAKERIFHPNKVQWLLERNHEEKENFWKQSRMCKRCVQAVRQTFSCQFGLIKILIVAPNNNKMKYKFTSRTMNKSFNFFLLNLNIYEIIFYVKICHIATTISSNHLTNSCALSSEEERNKNWWHNSVELIIAIKTLRYLFLG